MAAIEKWYDRLDREACEQYELGRRERQRRKLERRRWLLAWLAASVVAWVALMLVGDPYESVADFARQGLGQLPFAACGGLILLAGACFLEDIYFWARHGMPPRYFD